MRQQRMRSILLLCLLLPCLLVGLQPEQRALLQGAEAAFKQGAWDQAIEQWDALIDTALSGKQRRLVLLNKASALLQAGRFAASVDLYESIAEDETAQLDLRLFAYETAARVHARKAEQDCSLDAPESAEVCSESISTFQRAEALVARATSLQPNETLDLLAQQLHNRRLRLQSWLEQQQRTQRDIVESLNYLHKQSTMVDSLESTTLQAIRIEQLDTDWLSTESKLKDATQAAKLNKAYRDFQRAKFLSSRLRLDILATGVQDGDVGERILELRVLERDNTQAQGILSSLFQEWLDANPGESQTEVAVYQWVKDRLSDVSGAPAQLELYRQRSTPETELLLQLLEQSGAIETPQAAAQARFEIKEMLAEDPMEQARAFGASQALAGPAGLESVRQALLVWGPAALLQHDLAKLEETLSDQIDEKQRVSTQKLLRSADAISHSTDRVSQYPWIEPLKEDLAQLRTRLEDALSAERAPRPFHMGAYLRDARQWTRRAQRELQPPMPPSPVDTLSWAVSEQGHAFDLNQWLHLLEKEETLERELYASVVEGQQAALEAILPWPEATADVPTNEEPWPEVLPLVDQGRDAAEQAHRSLVEGLPKLTDALQLQKRAVELWEEALEKLTPPNDDSNDDQQDPPEDDQDEEAPPEPEQSPPSPQRDGSSEADSSPPPPPEPTDVLQLLRQMEEEDTPVEEADGPVQEGVRPW